MHAATLFAVNAAPRLTWLLRFPLFQHVRRLLVAASVCCHRPGAEREMTWRRWTERVARLPLLRELHVHIFFVSGGREYWAERATLLEALREVGRKSVFVVTEYHRLGVEVAEVEGEGMPFVLRQGFYVK
jgi:hypothetical protein